MLETSNATPGPGLPGDSGQAPAPKAPGLVEQLVGVFTEPSALFDRLRLSPSWVPAVILGCVAALAVTIVWGVKVDPDAMLRPILERNPRVAADQIDTIIQMQSKFILPFGILGALIGPWVVTLMVGFLLWLVSRGFQEEGAPPSFNLALTAAAVSSLVIIPHSLLTLMMALVKPVGGLSPEKLPPTSAGFYLVPEAPKLQALLYRIDLFALVYYAVIYVACRRLLRLNAAGAALASGLLALFSLGLPVLLAQ